MSTLISPPWSRRRLLRTTLGLSPLVLGGLLAQPAGAWAAVCRATPRQSEGPFYPRDFGRPGNDLIAVGADGKLPQGEPILLSGRVTDAACTPVAGAEVQIWQADAAGRYAHDRDADAAQRDPHFRYWGLAVTDADGSYAFRTILPAPYKMFWSSWRAPHIHFKARRPGGPLFTSQLYFAGHELNAKDGLYRGVDEAARAAVIATPGAGVTGGSAGTPPFKPWSFDIALG